MNREQQQKQQPPQVCLEIAKEVEKNRQDALKDIARVLLLKVTWIKAGLFDPSNT